MFKKLNEIVDKHINIHEPEEKNVSKFDSNSSKIIQTKD